MYSTIRSYNQNNSFYILQVNFQESFLLKIKQIESSSFDYHCDYVLSLFIKHIVIYLITVKWITFLYYLSKCYATIEAEKLKLLENGLYICWCGIRFKSYRARLLETKTPISYIKQSLISPWLIREIINNVYQASQHKVT